MARRKVARPATGDPSKAQKVAAAEQVVREIAVAWEEQKVDGIDWFTVRVKPLAYTFTVKLQDGLWRKIQLNLDHIMVWRGEVRHGTNGQLLFAFHPEMNSLLQERKAEYIEVAHNDLTAAFGPEFGDWLTNMMGSTVEELLAQALFAIDDEDVGRAEVKVKTPEPEATFDETTIKDFGLFA